MFVSKKLHKQKGQSLIYVAILIVILISGVFFVFDIGTMVNTKIKFQNGADAAALASVAVKISKHHTDTLVRASMYHESIAAQAYQRAAQATLVHLLLSSQKTLIDFKPPVPNIPTAGNPDGVQGPTVAMPGQKEKDLADKYIAFANKTYRHVVKIHRERLALEGYYSWLTGRPAGMDLGVGRQATTEAARIGFRINTPGLLSIGNNLQILTNTNELIENKPTFGNISGVAYGDEGATRQGNFGKTFVEFDGEGARSINGVSFLKYTSRYVMTTNAAAKIASTDDLNLHKTKLGIPPAELQMRWYSPRLMSIDIQTGKTIH